MVRTERTVSIGGGWSVDWLAGLIPALAWVGGVTQERTGFPGETGNVLAKICPPPTPREGWYRPCAPVMA